MIQKKKKINLVVLFNFFIYLYIYRNQFCCKMHMQMFCTEVAVLPAEAEVTAEVTAKVTAKVTAVAKLFWLGEKKKQVQSRDLTFVEK